jgi:diacylglycerol kinase (CTP)
MAGGSLSDFLVSAGVTIVVLLSLHVFLGLNPGLFNDERLQIRRKLQHVTTGLLFYSLDPVFDKFQACCLLWFGVVVIYSFHLARKQYPVLNEHFIRVCKAYLRPNELHHLPGAFFFFLGVSITVSVFSRRIALLGLLYLSVGDPVASFFGITYGSKWGPKFSNGKSFVGMLAMIILCFVMTVLTLARVMDFSTLMCWALVGSVAAGLAESSPLFNFLGMDDNLRVPLVSASTLWLLQNVVMAPAY